MKEKRGSLIGSGKKISIVASRFNELITKNLVDSCLQALFQQGVEEKDVICVWVPGALEIPLAAKKMAKKKPHAIICLGAIIRGDTPHFEYVASQTSRSLVQLGLEEELPVIYGIITADSLEQALERAGAKYNRGRESALQALEMANLVKGL